MALQLCKNHPGKKAVAHCETCHIPLCEECAIPSEHPKHPKAVFCSEQHRQNFMNFAATENARQIPRMRNSSMFIVIPRFLAGLAVAYLLVWYFFRDMLPPWLVFF
ncbi:MAG: B-box zinc finger protein [Candidatus Sumerlaeia bacterium]|nr:B-box zinc finger protein [Candidatus Sumerlaeia bacterium]